MTEVISKADRLVNGFIGLALSLVLLLLFFHMIRWALNGNHTGPGRTSIAGAIRAFIALFLMIDIWAIMRLLQRVVDISPALAYVIVIMSAALLFAWSLFGIGALLVDGLTHEVNALLSRSIRAIRSIKHGSPIVRYVQARSNQALRLFVILSAGIGVTALSLFWTYSGHDYIARPVIYKDTVPTEEQVYALPLTHEPGDAEILGTTYRNFHYGIELTFPDGWVLEESKDRNSLLSAYSADEDLYVQLNAGIFEDIVGGSHEEYLTGMWRVQKYIAGSFAEQSVGVVNSSVVNNRDIAYSSSTLITLASYWRFEGDSVGVVYDSYLVFRNNPVFFTLQVKSWGDAPDGVHLRTIEELSASIKLTPLTP